MAITPASFATMPQPASDLDPAEYEAETRLKTEQDEWMAAQRLGAQLPPQGWQPPDLRRIQDIKTTDSVAGQNALLVTVEGDANPFLVLDRQHPDAYKKLTEYRDSRLDLKGSNDEGYKTVKSDKDVPAYGDYVRFGGLDEVKDAIRFEYTKDGKVEKGVVHKSETPELYERIKKDREIFNKTNDWSKQNNVPIAGKDYAPPMLSHVDKIERVNGLGQDAIRVKAKDGAEQLVLKNVVGKDKFAQLDSYIKHDEYLKKMEGLGARVWNQAKFDTTKEQLKGTVDTVLTTYEKNGILLVQFKDGSKDSGTNFFKGQLIAFSEKKHPEAFAIIRKFAHTGNDGYPGSIDSGAPPNGGGFILDKGWKDLFRQMTGD